MSTLIRAVTMSTTLTMEPRSGTSWGLTRYITLERTRRCYLRLASESSKASDDESESVYSLQDKETDFVRDTSDTESRSSGHNADVYNMEFEYEVASLSENDIVEYSTTDSEAVMFVAGAAVIYDVDLHSNSNLTEAADVEDTDSSSVETPVISRRIGTCVKCKRVNRNPLLKYCEKCFQDRRKHLPPRPQRKKRKIQPKPTVKSPVKLDTLRNCLSGLSHESGLETSQQCPQLGLDQIKVPERSKGKHKLEKNTDGVQSSTKTIESTCKSNDESSEDVCSTKIRVINASKRIRKDSESSLSDFEIKHPKLVSTQVPGTSDLGSEVNSRSFTVTSLSSELGGITSTPSSSSGVFSGPSTSSCTVIDADKPDPCTDNSEMCIVCNSVPKNSVFLHQNLAHRCCCYTCAKKIQKTTKRCPICNRTVHRVVRLFTA